MAFDDPRGDEAGAFSCSVRIEVSLPGHTSTGIVLAWGCIFSVMLIRRFGRLPVLFWSQVCTIPSETQYTPC